MTATALLEPSFVDLLAAIAQARELSEQRRRHWACSLQQIAKWLPADQMLVETDSPFLAPVPHRGQKCEPAFVADTAAFVANLRGEDPERLGDVTTANFFKLFDKAQG